MFLFEAFLYLLPVVVWAVQGRRPLAPSSRPFRCLQPILLSPYFPFQYLQHACLPAEPAFTSPPRNWCSWRLERPWICRSCSTITSAMKDRATVNMFFTWLFMSKSSGYLTTGTSRSPSNNSLTSSSTVGKFPINQWTSSLIRVASWSKPATGF